MHDNLQYLEACRPEGRTGRLTFPDAIYIFQFWFSPPLWWLFLIKSTYKLRLSVSKQAIYLCAVGKNDNLREGAVR